MSARQIGVYIPLQLKQPLWKRLDSEILPFVTKPGRYANNELNTVFKRHEPGLLKIALCFPEMYEIGMSYLGMQILHHIINQRPDCVAERAFAVWPDMEDRMRAKSVPLFSLESSTPLAEFDVLGFHLTYEMTYTTALNMLELAGIPLRSGDRGEEQPLVLAGGSSTLNPEPMAEFIDAFFIGDAEEAVHEIIDSIKESRSKELSKERTLLSLTTIPGVYVPRFYEARYGPDGHFLALDRLDQSVPERIKIRSVKELKDEYYPPRPIVPFVETAHDHLTIEIMRGCVRGCRFCQAGYQYRPRRQRSPEAVAEQVFSSLQATGYEDVTLLSLSSTDYDHLGELLSKIGPRLTESRVALGLPSLRPETLRKSVVEAMSSARKTGLTLAPEAGTERLRNVLGKKISDEEIFRAIDIALGAGWQTFKLYFMMGLPTETEEDITGIVSLLNDISHRARRSSGRCNINVTLSPFNPKSHTPWQWERQVGTRELQNKIDCVIDGVRKRNINLKYRNLDLSYVEGIIGRGDRRLGNVLLKAHANGSRLDGWSEWFDANRWYAAFKNCGLDPEFYTGPMDENAPLPWDHIDKGISKDFLRKDNRQSKEGIAPASAMDRAKIDAGKESDVGFGRRARRAVRPSEAPAGTYKMRVRYSRGPDVRYLSHLDAIRALYRALRRSDIPIAFSEGFHPHVKISFGPPLPVGYTSDAEYFDLQLTQPYREEFIEQLKRSLPSGMELTGHKHYFANVSSLSKQLNLARYEIPAMDRILYDEGTIRQLLSNKKLLVKRLKSGVETEIDAGRFVEKILLHEGGLLIDVWQLPDGHVKSEEILIFGLGIEEELVRQMVIHRQAQFHKSGQRLIDPLDLV